MIGVASRPPGRMVSPVLRSTTAGWNSAWARSSAALAGLIVPRSTAADSPSPACTAAAYAQPAAARRSYLLMPGRRTQPAQASSPRRAAPTRRIPPPTVNVPSDRTCSVTSSLAIEDARDRIRTCAALRPEDFKSPASTSSATRAYGDYRGSSAASSAAPWRMSRSDTVSSDAPGRAHQLGEDGGAGDDRRRALRHQAAHLTPLGERQGGQPRELPLDRVGSQHVAVDQLRHLLVQAEIDRRQRGDGAGDADQPRVAGQAGEVGRRLLAQGRERLGGRRVVRQEPLGQPDAADVEAGRPVARPRARPRSARCCRRRCRTPERPRRADAPR